MTGYLDRAGFGVRVAFCAVAIALTCRPGSGFRTAVPVGYAFPAGT